MTIGKILDVLKEVQCTNIRVEEVEQRILVLENMATWAESQVAQLEKMIASLRDWMIRKTEDAVLT